MSDLLARVDTMLATYESRGNTNVPGTISLVRDLAAALQDGLATSSEPSSGRNFFKDAGELEAIVRDLAASDEPIADLDPEVMGDYVCMVCPESDDDSPVVQDRDDLVHAESCVWRRAVEFVAAHPVGDQQ